MQEYDDRFLAHTKVSIDLFDESVAPLVVKEYGADDIPAMSESFNNWKDSLLSDGALHVIQVNQYCYTSQAQVLGLLLAYLHQCHKYPCTLMQQKAVAPHHCAHTF